MRRDCAPGAEHRGRQVGASAPLSPLSLDRRGESMHPNRSRRMKCQSICPSAKPRQARSPSTRGNGRAGKSCVVRRRGPPSWTGDVGEAAVLLIDSRRRRPDAGEGPGFVQGSASGGACPAPWRRPDRGGDRGGPRGAARPRSVRKVGVPGQPELAMVGSWTATSPSWSATTDVILAAGVGEREFQRRARANSPKSNAGGSASSARGRAPLSPDEPRSSPTTASPPARPPALRCARSASAVPKNSCSPFRSPRAIRSKRCEARSTRWSVSRRREFRRRRLFLRRFSPGGGRRSQRDPRPLPGGTLGDAIAAPARPSSLRQPSTI